MTRKDYILIAEALRVSRQIALAGPGFTHKPNLDEVRGIEDAAAAIANRLLNQNPGFDRAHFLAVVRGEKELDSKPERKRVQSFQEAMRCPSCDSILSWTSKDGYRHQFGRPEICPVSDDDLNKREAN